MLRRTWLTLLLSAALCAPAWAQVRPIVVGGGGTTGTFPDYLQLVTVNTAAPPAGDCDAAGETGRMYWNSTGDAYYLCSGASGWVLVNAAGAGTGLSYVTSTAEGTLSNEQNIGALTTGLLVNSVAVGVGTLSTFVPSSACGAGQFVTTLSASGATTCGTPAITGGSKLSAFAATTSAELAGVISDETGTGLLVYDTAPLFASTGRFGAAATYDGIIVSPTVKGANQFDLTLSTVDLTAARAINFPNEGGTVALTADKLSAFAATTSAELAGVISDETGSGALMFGTSPTFTTDLTGATLSKVRIVMATPAAAPTITNDASGTLAVNAYKMTLTVVDAGGGETLYPTAATCTVTAITDDACIATWTAIPGAATYRVWMSDAGGVTPNKYWPMTSPTLTKTITSLALTGVVAATLPTASTAYFSNIDSNGTSWLGGLLTLTAGTTPTATYAVNATSFIGPGTTSATI